MLANPFVGDLLNLQEGRIYVGQAGKQAALPYTRTCALWQEHSMVRFVGARVPAQPRCKCMADELWMTVILNQNQVLVCGAVL